MNSRSQTSQDIFVANLIDNSEQRYFVDIGCNEPFEINNTSMLEELGWKGISLDINGSFSKAWQARKTKFIVADALTTDYADLYARYEIPDVIDYLTLDIEGSGLRYRALSKVMQAKNEYKIITVEHDSYRGYYETEVLPQRKLLTEIGYTLLCSNVKSGGNPYEDWWINEKYITANLENIKCEGVEHSEIIQKLKK